MQCKNHIWFPERSATRLHDPIVMSLLGVSMKESFPIINNFPQDVNVQFTDAPKCTKKPQNGWRTLHQKVLSEAKDGLFLFGNGENLSWPTVYRLSIFEAVYGGCNLFLLSLLYFF